MFASIHINENNVEGGIVIVVRWPSESKLRDKGGEKAQMRSRKGRDAFVGFSHEIRSLQPREAWGAVPSDK